MAFREKSAWISFLSTFVVYGTYFTLFVQALTQGRTHGADLFGAFVASVVALVALQVALQIAIAITAPKDAATARDERERLIDLRATRWAFFALQGAVFCALGTLHLGGDRFLIVNAVFAALVLSELVRSGGQVALYRQAAA